MARRRRRRRRRSGGRGRGGGAGDGPVPARPGQDGGQQVTGVSYRVALLPLVNGDVRLNIAVPAHPLRRRVAVASVGRPRTAPLNTGQGPHVLREPDPGTLIPHVLVGAALVDQPPPDDDKRPQPLVESRGRGRTGPPPIVGIARSTDHRIVTGDKHNRVGRHTGTDPRLTICRHHRRHSHDLRPRTAAAHPAHHHPHQDHKTTNPPQQQYTH